MRRGFFSLFMLALAVNLPAQWRETAPTLLGPITPNSGAIFFKSGILWAAKDQVWKSTDSGFTWQQTSLSVPDHVCDISFVDDHNGIVATYGGTVYLTRDGGASWQNIYQAGSTCAAALLDSNTILVCEKEPGGVDYSWDGGTTWNTSYGDSWDHDVFAGPKAGTAYMLSANYSTYMHLWYSTDKGASWAMQPGVLDVDCWSAAVDPCNPKQIYAVNEGYAYTVDYNGNSRLFVSSDEGSTWTATYHHNSKFFAGALSLGPHTIFVATVSEANAGVLRSSDRGASWQNIGGPSNSADSRLIAALDDNHVVAPDINGSMWVTTNSGGDSITLPQFAATVTELVLPSATSRISPSTCGVIDTSVIIEIISCSEPNASLDSIWLDGSSAFSISDKRSTPRPIAAIDSISVSYLASGSASDTATLHLRYDVGSGPLDTSILLVGVATPASHPSLLHRASTSAYYGAVDTLPLVVDISSAVNMDSLWPYLSEIQATYSWDSSVVSFDGYNPPAGWVLNSLANHRNSLDFDIQNNGSVATQPLDLGTALFTPHTTELATSWVELPVLTLTVGGDVLSLCTSENEDSHWSVKGLGALSEVSSTEKTLATARIWPNPVSGEIFVENSGPAAAHMEIYDALGRDVASGSIPRTSTASFDLRELPGGVYFVRITSGGSATEQAIVKQ